MSHFFKRSKSRSPSPPPSNSEQIQYAREYYNQKNSAEGLPLLEGSLPGRTNAQLYEREQHRMNSAFAATYGAPTKVPRPVPIDATSNTKEGWRIAGRTQSPPPQLIEYGERSALPKKKVGAIGVAYTTDACSAGPRRPSLGDPPRPTAIYGASKYKGGPKNEYAARCEVRLQPHYPMKADFLGPSKCANPPGNCVENVTIRGMLEAGHRNITSTVMKNSKDGVTIPMCEQCVVLVGDDVKKHPQATITDGATGVRYLMAPKRRAFSMGHKP